MPVLPKSREETYLGPLSFHLAMASILSSQPEIEELFPLTPEVHVLNYFCLRACLLATVFFFLNNDPL